MTIGQRRQHQSVTVRKSFMISDKQKENLHEAAQRQLFELSDVHGDLYLKQQQAAFRKQQQAAFRKQRAAEWKRKRAFVYQKKLFDKDYIKEGENSNVGTDHLLILANSAELLESQGDSHNSQSNDLAHEGQNQTDKPLDSTQVNDKVEAEENAPRVRGRFRLTQIRRQARNGNSLTIREDLVSHGPDLRRFDDSNNGRSVEVDQVQGVTGHQDAKDPYVAAKGGSEGMEGIQKQASFWKALKLTNQNWQPPVVESAVIIPPSVQMTTEHRQLVEPQSDACRPTKNALKINNEYLQPLSVESRVIIPQPVQMTTEHGQLIESQTDARRLTQVVTAETNGPLKEHYLKSRQKCAYAQLDFNAQRSQSLVQILEVPKNHQYIARQRRRLRTLKRRAQRYDSPFQSTANIRARQMPLDQPWWLWHAQNEHMHLSKQQLAFYVSCMEREQRRMAAQQKRARRIEEQRASKIVHQQLNNPQSVEQSHFEKGCPDPNIGTGAKQKSAHVQVNRSFQHLSIAQGCEGGSLVSDQRRQLQQRSANVEDEEQAQSVRGRMRLTRLKRKARVSASVKDKEKAPCVEGRMRLTWLKREARLKFSPAEMTSGGSQ